jgi:hypothetical protein
MIKFLYLTKMKTDDGENNYSGDFTCFLSPINDKELAIFTLILCRAYTKNLRRFSRLREVTIWSKTPTDILPYILRSHHQCLYLSHQTFIVITTSIGLFLII